MRRILLPSVVLALATIALSTAGAAQPPIKIGFISTFSGPGGVLGQALADGFKLGLKSTGDKLGGRPVEVIYGDDQASPAVGRQLADKMIERDGVKILTGVNFSNVFLAVAKPALDAGVFVISVTSGPSQYAGKLCNPHLFVTSFQNDEVTESIAIYMQQKKIPDTYFLGPNYQGGRDQLSGLKRYYKGKLSVIWTTLGQLDYSGEIARVRASNPTSIVFFYPGGMGINFLKQFEQSGLKGKIPLYVGASILDQTILPATGDSALGVKAAAFWSEQLDNAASKKFTSDFENTYHRIPSPYSATAYDAVRMMDAALATIGGKIEDKQGFQHAMENVKFDSVRGAFKFNTNHFPIQNAYLTEIVKDDQGRPINALRGVIVKNMTDSYVHECKMHR